MLRKIMTAIAGTSFLLSLNLQADSAPSADMQMQKPSSDCSERFWFDAEYLYWKIKDSPKIVPLVVQDSTSPTQDDVLDLPGTKIVLGNKKTDLDWRSGARFGLGYWFTHERSIGMEANYFFLPTESKKRSVFSDGSSGSPFFVIPFYDVNADLETFVVIANPTHFEGKATLKVSNFMQGAELNGLTSISQSCRVNFDLLGGFRYWNFVEHLSFNTDSPYVPPHVVDIYQTKDKFRARNNFYGGQVGAKLDYVYHGFFLNLKGKVALGALCQTSSIHGRFFTNDFTHFTSPVTYKGGYFALPSNIGHHRHTRFSVIPEGNIDIGYQFAKYFRLQGGYSFLYASKVLFATKQVDRHINPTQSGPIEYVANAQLVGEARPKGSLKTEGLWAQGVSVGFQFRY